LTAAVTHEKIALVTGAGAGIGRATSLALVRAGYTVVLAGRTLAPLEATAEMASKFASQRTWVVPTDVANPIAVNNLFAKIESNYGRIDVLFNNAGMFAPTIPMDEITFEQWSQVVNINLTGSFLCAQGAMRLMKKQTPMGGRIINNGSISAHAPRPMSAPYTSTKHAITGLTKSIALDGRAYNIACSQIDIGNAATDMTTAMAAGIMQPRGDLMVEDRMNVTHVADMVVHIANLPLDTNVLFTTIMATKMPMVGRG
jgi:NAD(P)-dependent dehydrogenase (short-subunit alcohol dehydrogenase family)